MSAGVTPWTTMIGIPYSPNMVGFTREVVGAVVGKRHPHAANARQVASELVTNAVMHANGAPGAVIDILLEVTRESVRIEVHDDGPGLPAHRELGEGGYGLVIVEKLADKCGHEDTDRGAVWWAELAGPTPAEAHPEGQATATTHPEEEPPHVE